MNTAKLICMAIGHTYTSERVYSDDEAEVSICKRCGHKRYKPPTDTPGGFEPQSFTG